MFDPMSAGMSAASLLAGLLGGGGEAELPPEIQRILKQYQKLYQEQREYGKGIPLSDAQEQAALASAKGLAGADLGYGRDQLLASLGANNPNAGTALGQYNANAAGTLAGMDSQHLLASLGSRQQAKWGGAASMLQGALGAASGPRVSGGPDLTGLLMGLGQTLGGFGYKSPKPINFNFGGGGGVNYGGDGITYADDMNEWLRKNYRWDTEVPKAEK